MRIFWNPAAQAWLEKKRVVDITDLSDEEAEVIVNMVEILRKKHSIKI